MSLVSKLFVSPEIKLIQYQPKKMTETVEEPYPFPMPAATPPNQYLAQKQGSRGNPKEDAFIDKK